jgi:RNA polymerase sigma-70 factor (ECF subfamily)
VKVPPKIDEFHAGEASSLEQCYRDHFDDVKAAVGRVLRGADQETVIQHVFYRLVADPALRANFRGGNLAAWLTTIARNEALSYCRRYGREQPMDDSQERADASPSKETAVDAKLLVERFCLERLPAKLRGVFDARFLRQLSQREAAVELGIRRSTLAYQEEQIREAFRTFVLEET